MYLSLSNRLAASDDVVQAKNHGNEPSKGAKIDAEIQAEEEEMMKSKKPGFGSKK